MITRGIARAVMMASQGEGPPEHVSTSAAYISSAWATSHTLSVAVSAQGPNRKLVVGIVAEGPTVTGVTYNGVAMTQAVMVNNAGNRTYLYYMDEANLPTDGNPHDLVVSLSSSDHTMFCASLYRNIAQGAPAEVLTDAQGGGAQASVTFASVPDDSLICDAVGSNGDTTFTPGPNQTERIDVNGVPDGQTLAMSDVIGVTGSVTVSQDPANYQANLVAARWSPA